MKYDKNLRQEAKKSVKSHYFRNVIIAFICSIILAGGYNYVTNNILEVEPTGEEIREVIDKNNKKTNSEIIDDLLNKTSEEKEHEQAVKNKYSAGVLSTIVNEITASGSFVFGILNAINNLMFSGNISVFILIILGSIIAFSVNTVFVNVIRIGKNRYFLEKRKYLDTKIDRLLFPYKVKKMLHLSYILFIREVYQFLWDLTIIGGFIKYYEYSMIPYILAENPCITKKEAFLLSKELTKNNKFNLFKVDLSLLGWNILGALTFNLTNVFYFNVYKEFIYAELYMNLRNSNKETIEKGNLLNDNYLDIKVAVEEEYPEEKFSISTRKNRKWLNIDYNKKYSFTSYILLFFTFSSVGWIWEVFFHIVEEGKFVNRGTMFGPWLPIYGFGGIMILIFLKKFRDNPFLLFMSAFVLCGVVEYGTAWYLETFRGMKWWDYSGYFLNIDGRVCLEGLLVFGLGGCAFTYLFAPILDNLYVKIKPKIKYVICTVLVALFLIDFVYSSIHPNSGEGITSYNVNDQSDIQGSTQ